MKAAGKNRCTYHVSKFHADYCFIDICLTLAKIERFDPCYHTCLETYIFRSPLIANEKLLSAAFDSRASFCHTEFIAYTFSLEKVTII